MLRKAILVPSGGQAGPSSLAGSVVSRVWAVPSAFMTQMTPPPVAELCTGAAWYRFGRQAQAPDPWNLGGWQPTRMVGVSTYAARPRECCQSHASRCRERELRWQDGQLHGSSALLGQ